MILKIKNVAKVDFFNEFNITLKYDAVASTFSFSAYFDPNNEDHKRLWKPGSFHQVEIEEGDELLLRGYILNHQFTQAATKQLVAVAGYSLPGVLEDCQVPTSAYPLQNDGKSLKSIAEKLLKPFGIKLIVDSIVSGESSQGFETSTSSATQSVKQYLSSMASQKDIIISHNAEGDLVFTKANSKTQPILDITSGIPNVTMGLSFAGQQMHSQITVMKEVDADGGNAGESTIKNPFVLSTFRSAVKTQSSGDDNSTGKAARNALSAEMKNIKLIISTDRWKLDGKVIKPGNIITVQNDELYLYKRNKWFIEEVQLKGNHQQTTATITCVPPSVYDGSAPTNIFE